MKSTCMLVFLGLLMDMVILTAANKLDDALDITDVSQSSTYDNKAENAATNAVDGDLDTRSVTKEDSPAWLQLELKKQMEIGTIKIYLHTYAYNKGYYQNFKVATKLKAGDAWKTCYEVSSVTIEYNPLIIKLSDYTKARFVKISVDHKPSPEPLYIREIKILEKADLALTKDVSQSSTYGGKAGNAATNAVDGDLDTRSVTGEDSPAWLQFELKKQMEIGTIKIYLHKYAYNEGYYQNFKVATKLKAGDAWKTCYEVASVKGEYNPLIIKLSEYTKAGFVKISVDHKPSPEPLYINEIKILEKADLALTKDVSQSSTYGGKAENAATNAVDGDLDTRSVTGEDSPAWLQFELKKQMEIGTMKIYLNKYAYNEGYYQNFKVATKLKAGDAWKTFYEVPSVIGEYEPLIIKLSEYTKAGFIKISVDHKPSPQPLYINEIKIVDRADFVNANSFTKCARDFKKVGCYKQGQTEMELSLTYREGPILIDWKKYPETIHSLACSCAALTKSKGKKYFSIRFYGECWIGEKYSQLQNLMSTAKSVDGCVGGDYKPCDDVKKEECTGKAHNDYMYSLVGPTVTVSD